ncbi:MAG: UDP-glucose--hexose-1-phosphate uridylyltransferase [Anaerolineales bacterium]|nr:UDP-glucose--hexose-1-phosphate uridylyltransferase [Anaerolineales bacterium]
MSNFKLFERPHRRYNPLTGAWVQVSPHRLKRPWRGQIENVPIISQLPYDPNCYLCPGNSRASGGQNPIYNEPFIFPNDYPAILPELSVVSDAMNPLFQISSVQGLCQVMCFSPRHDLTLPEMEIGVIEQIVEVWVEQTAVLGETYRWVQIFENKGALMGCSNPHPHCQIFAVDVLPNEAAREEEFQQEYWNKHKRPLLLHYAQQELEYQERIVTANEHWLVVVPFWAGWPYETLLLPHHRAISRLSDLKPTEKSSLASLLKQFLILYDNLFETSFPYTMGWHSAPFSNQPAPYWQLHAHFYPPLLRSATIKKFMVGYEMLSEIQRDLTPEQAADQLRLVSTTHYKLNS